MNGKGQKRGARESCKEWNNGNKLLAHINKEYLISKASFFLGM